MRRIFAALLLFLPLAGCVVHEHYHDDGYRGWKGRPYYDRQVPPSRGYYWGDHDRRYDDRRDRDGRW